MERCSTKHAPWFVIPSNHKWFRNLAVSSIIAGALEDMNIQMPKPTVDIEQIRKLYHQAEEAENGKAEKKKKEPKGKADRAAASAPPSARA
jgi:phage FluMu gp28-like protein